MYTHQVLDEDDVDVTENDQVFVNDQLRDMVDQVFRTEVKSLLSVRARVSEIGGSTSGGRSCVLSRAD